jgi:hypothetical protein
MSTVRWPKWLTPSMCSSHGEQQRAAPVQALRLSEVVFSRNTWAASFISTTLKAEVPATWQFRRMVAEITAE